jgi:peroxiredoxin
LAFKVENMSQKHPNYSTILKQGDRSKGFALQDTDGGIVSLPAVLQHGPVIIVFYRGDW